MKDTILSSLIIILAFIITDVIFYNAYIYIGVISQIRILDFFISSLLLFLLFENLIYNKFFNLESSRLKIIIFVAVPLVLSMHIVHRLHAIEALYFNSKNLTKQVSSGLWEFDNLLGHKSIPDSRGEYIYYIGDSIKGSVPVIFNSSGYRTAPDSLKIKSNSIDLYLGCSYTFGDYIGAEDGYPYLTSKSLNHSYINAGASAYGIGQMFQLFEKLMKKHQFKYVFIQLSPWLSSRAMHLNGPTFYGYRPFPYFSDEENRFKLNPPAYSTLMYSEHDWRNNNPSYFEKIHFSFSDGGKTEIIDYYAYQHARLKKLFGLIPGPTKRKADLEKFFYDYIIEISKKHNSIPVILKIGYKNSDNNELLKYLSLKTKVIDLDRLLQKHVDQSGMTYEKLYSICHEDGEDCIIYDDHPNKYANKLFANKIYSELSTE